MAVQSALKTRVMQNCRSFSAAILTKNIQNVPPSDMFWGTMKIWSFYFVRGVTKTDLLRS
jgi:hypothetical protein